MEQSEQTNDKQSEFNIAFSACQAEFPILPRSKTVKVSTRTGGSYSFSYAPLEEILRLYRPLLTRHGFSLTQTLEAAGEGWVVKTFLGFKNGVAFVSTVPVFHVEQGPQAFSSGVTYARRTGVTLVLCLAADDDDDANAAEGNKASFGDRSGRPDTSGVDQAEVQSLVEDFTFALSKSDIPSVLSTHDKIATKEALYTAVWDRLSSKQTTALRKIISERK